MPTREAFGRADLGGQRPGPELWPCSPKKLVRCSRDVGSREEVASAGRRSSQEVGPPPGYAHLHYRKVKNNHQVGRAMEHQERTRSSALQGLYKKPTSHPQLVQLGSRGWPNPVPPACTTQPQWMKTAFAGGGRGPGSRPCRPLDPNLEDAPWPLRQCASRPRRRCTDLEHCCTAGCGARPPGRTAPVPVVRIF